jgi:hypothetical protein
MQQTPQFEQRISLKYFAYIFAFILNTAVYAALRRKFKFNNSAQAIFLNGMRVALRFRLEAYSIKLFFPEALWIPIS